jgi:acetoacetyl-CoA synthetase
VIFRSEFGEERSIGRLELNRLVASVAAGLRRLGVERGDRVVGYLPNIPEAVVAFLATASVGAIWSMCAPEFGTRSVVDRFRQIEPKILFAARSYRYGGRVVDRREEVLSVVQELPTLLAVVDIPYVDADGDPVTPHAIAWNELTQTDAELEIDPVPFGHPLWVLYSSGTTGLPKPIVHGHGGIVLEHLKTLSLHLDLHPGERLLWFTTTGWMMWNFLVGGLLVGSTIVAYDGSASYPDLMALWRLTDELDITYFGTSAAFIAACMKAGTDPGRNLPLRSLAAVGATGSPLSPEGFAWVYEHVKPDILLGSISGGTDVCTALVGSCPMLPVHAGEIQCRLLGAKVEAFDASGRSVVGETGELVVTEPMPSMPLYFWNDLDRGRYRDSYFNVYPGLWRHGDWVRITERGTCLVQGRSDATLNRSGVRMGSAEFYRVVESIPEIADSLVVDTATPDGRGRLFLFVVLSTGVELDEALRRRIESRIRSDLSPRYVPDEIRAIAAVPRTLNGKKMEVPVRKLLLGHDPATTVSIDAMANPDSLEPFLATLKARET